MSTQAELVSQLHAVTTQNQKTAKEIASIQKASDDLQTKIKALEEQIANGEVSEELTAAVAEVKASAQALDDEIPDLPEPPPETTETPES